MRINRQLGWEGKEKTVLNRVVKNGSQRQQKRLLMGRCFVLDLSVEQTVHFSFSLDNPNFNCMKGNLYVDLYRAVDRYYRYTRYQMIRFHFWNSSRLWLLIWEKRKFLLGWKIQFFGNSIYLIETYFNNLVIKYSM